MALKKEKLFKDRLQRLQTFLSIAQEVRDTLQKKINDSNGLEEQELEGDKSTSE